MRRRVRPRRAPQLRCPTFAGVTRGDPVHVLHTSVLPPSTRTRARAHLPIDVTSNTKPCAPACERNKDAILAVLREELAVSRAVLEIGSGTGQHAAYFASAMSHLHWHASDIADNQAGIEAWLREARASDPPVENLHGPYLLDVRQGTWPLERADAVFSANAVHIMSWPEVEAMFTGIGRVLAPGGKLCLYGPFNYGGRYTSESNARFDEWLQDRDTASAIRNFEDLDALARDIGLRLTADHDMPANNRILVWTRS
ncbi:MAG: DUF938 domain-containing protein [Myxococcales bacterium]|jgi:SAM-dependent methyltransferase|nr:MAG: DUF938 domain-containing protein [Myxococcales bacterium]